MCSTDILDIIVYNSSEHTLLREECSLYLADTVYQESFDFQVAKYE